MDTDDGDADDEPEQDCCEAGDDEVRAGIAPGYRWHRQSERPGCEDDAEPKHAAAFDRDQSARPAIRYDQPERRRPPEPPIVSNVGPLVPVKAGLWRVISAPVVPDAAP